jgi:hypothetical protein
MYHGCPNRAQAASALVHHGSTVWKNSMDDSSIDVGSINANDVPIQASQSLLQHMCWHPSSVVLYCSVAILPRQQLKHMSITLGVKIVCQGVNPETQEAAGVKI